MYVQGYEQRSDNQNNQDNHPVQGRQCSHPPCDSLSSAPPARAAAGRARAVGVTAMLAGLGLFAAAAGTASAQTTRVSVTQAGAEVDQGSRAPSVSADGRWVAFASDATNLVAGDANGRSDVFLKDRQDGTVTRVSAPAPGGTEGGGTFPVISADGRFVAFTSPGGLVPADTVTCPVPDQPSDTCLDTYVYDRTNSTLELVSVASNGTQGNSSSTVADISADGRFVVFNSFSSNLVANDTNTVVDVFLRDRQAQTTTRISVATGGGQSARMSAQAAIADDGSLIAFLSAGGTALDATPDRLSCPPDVENCLRVYLHERVSGATSRVHVNLPEAPGGGYQVADLRMSADGGVIGVVVLEPIGTWQIYTLDRATGQLHKPRGASQDAAFRPTYAISGNGRYVASCVTSDFNRLTVTDLETQAVEFIPDSPPALPDDPLRHCADPVLSADGLTVIFASNDTNLVASDQNGATDIFAFDRDADDDGLPGAWETFFGLDPAGPGDASADSDGDGATNLQEYAAGTHPKGTFTRYLAEGSSNGFFSTTIFALNPDNGDAALTPAPVVIRYFGANGLTSTSTTTIPEGQVWRFGPRVGIPEFPGDSTPDDNFSTLIESDRPLAVEREMRWVRGDGAGGFVALGAHAETGIPEPRTTWYLAEGATHGPFNLFYLVQNPGDADAEVTVTYLLPAPAAPIVQTYTAKAHSRLTIPVDDQPGLGATDVSAKITADQPVLVERTMYLSTAAQPFVGGHSGAGIAEPLTEWFVAESATGAFFNSFLLVGNPGDTDAALTISYFLEDGTTFDKDYVVAKQSRLTIVLNADDPRLASTSVSARVTSTNGVPVVVERATWWPGSEWYEGHLTAASSATSRRWAVANAPVKTTEGLSTFLLIANPNAEAGTVTIKLKGGEGYYPAACTATVNVPAHSRVTTDVAAACGIGFTNNVVYWGGTVESDGPDIVVERASYVSGWAGFWSSGVATALTRLP